MQTQSSRITVIVGCFLVFITPALTSAQETQDEATTVASRIVGNLNRAWNNGDANAWAAEYWPDAEFINIFGAVMDGREVIAAEHDKVLKGRLKGSQTTMKIRKVRQVAPTVIIVDTNDTNTGPKRTEPPPPGTPQGTQTRLKHIIEKRDGVWHIVASQNTAVRQ